MNRITAPHHLPSEIAAQARALSRLTIWTVIGMAAVSLILKVIVGG